MEFILFCLEVFFWVFVIRLAISFVLGVWEGTNNVRELERRALYQKFDEIVHRVEVEKHGDIIYWFDEDDREFLGQGLTEQECIEHVKKRFPTHMFFFPDNRVIRAPNWTFESYQVKTT